MARPDLTRFGVLSIVAALTTMGLKLVAWRVTDSVGLLSDALESTVNLVAAVLVVVVLRVAALPADRQHQFGHEKAELFSAGAEGLMIVVAALLILWTAVDRLLHPRPVERLGIGLAVSVAAALVNLAVALVLLRVGRRHRSSALAADGQHLLTDVWTTTGVVLGVLAVGITGWERLDPIVALAVGAYIVVIGVRLLWRAGADLMDPSLPPAELDAVRDVLARYQATGVGFHALRTRTAGQRRFLVVHVLVPGGWTVATGHDLLEEVEADLRRAVPHLSVTTHLEPIEDPVSYEDEPLDRDPA